MYHRGSGQLAEKSHKNEALEYRSVSRSNSELRVSLAENRLGGVEGPAARLKLARERMGVSKRREQAWTTTLRSFLPK